jgi:hypothetical protein
MFREGEKLDSANLGFNEIKIRPGFLRVSINKATIYLLSF